MAKPPRQTNGTKASGNEPAAGKPAAGRSAGKTGAAPDSAPKETKAGRGKHPAIRALAREHAAAAVTALAAVMNDPAATPAARVSAASALLNWGYGKPGQRPTDGTGTGGRGATEQVVRLIWGGDARP